MPELDCFGLAWILKVLGFLRIFYKTRAEGLFLVFG